MSLTWKVSTTTNINQYCFKCIEICKVGTVGLSQKRLKVEPKDEFIPILSPPGIFYLNTRAAKLADSACQLSSSCNVAKYARMAVQIGKELFLNNF